MVFAYSARREKRLTLDPDSLENIDQTYDVLTSAGIKLEDKLGGATGTFHGPGERTTMTGHKEAHCEVYREGQFSLVRKDHPVFGEATVQYISNPRNVSSDKGSAIEIYVDIFAPNDSEISNLLSDNVFAWSLDAFEEAREHYELEYEGEV